MEQFNLETYLSHGVENIVKGALRASLSNPLESLFMAQYAISSKAAAKRRHEYKEKGISIPPFLIASITSQCNLHCAGCYARANHSCHDKEEQGQLSDEEWIHIFEEAKELGISFILLAGGEPFVRMELIKAAGRYKSILFPVFTNGTLMNDEYLRIFDANRNLVPILSIEGNQVLTDRRRGDGVYEALTKAMQNLKKGNILFGTSVTVTKENLKEVTSDSFIEQLYESGCKVIFYVEFVPVDQDNQELAPGEEERQYLTQLLLNMRETYQDLLFISFPGDEKASGGCLAAGRGFFHINANGGAEPCPFSPYSDTNLRTNSLLSALQSPLFKALREEGMLIEEHVGGCVLFEKADQVKELLERA